MNVREGGGGRCARVADSAAVALASGFCSSRVRGLDAYFTVFALRLFKFNKLLYYLLR